MRPLLATACLCFLASSGSIAVGEKVTTDHIHDAAAVAPIAAATDGASRISKSLMATADRLAPPADAFDPLPLEALPAQFTQADPPKQADTSADAATPTPPLPLPPKPKRVVHRSSQEVCETVARAAQHNDLPVPFFIRLLFQESRFKPGVVSKAGAQGIAQFMPKTADAVGLDNPFDPLQAIPASARLLRDLFEQFGNLGLAAAAYNAGPKRIQDWLARKGKLPQETQGYVKTITGRPAENWKTASAGTPALKLPPHAPCQETAGLLAAGGPDRIPMPTSSPQRQVKIAQTPAKTVGKIVGKTKRAAKIAKQNRSRGKDTVNLAARRKAKGGKSSSRKVSVAAQ